MWERACTHVFGLCFRNGLRSAVSLAGTVRICIEPMTDIDWNPGFGALAAIKGAWCALGKECKGAVPEVKEGGRDGGRILCKLTIF